MHAMRRDEGEHSPWPSDRLTVAVVEGCADAAVDVGADARGGVLQALMAVEPGEE